MKRYRTYRFERRIPTIPQPPLQVTRYMDFPEHYSLLTQHCGVCYGMNLILDLRMVGDDPSPKSTSHRYILSLLLRSLCQPSLLPTFKVEQRPGGEGSRHTDLGGCDRIVKGSWLAKSVYFSMFSSILSAVSAMLQFTVFFFFSFLWDTMFG